MKISRNSIVTLHHRLGLTDGTVLEDTFNDEPLTYRLGSGELAQGLELALIGLKEGDRQTLDINPDLAFGFPEDDMRHSLDRSDFGPQYQLEPGLIIEFSTPSGETLPGTILEVHADSVLVDFNHPLAGQVVRYEVEIVQVDNDDDKDDLVN